MPGLPPDTFSTYRAISTFTIIGKKLNEDIKTVNWLKNLQQPYGAFLYRPVCARSLVGTYMAIAALYLLDSRPKYIKEAIAWVTAHQKSDGGFRLLGSTSATTDESFTCVQTLLILNQTLTKYWVTVIN